MSTVPVVPSPVQVVQSPSPAVKPGILTTEFWLTVLAQIFLTLNTTGAWKYIHPSWASLIAQGGILGAYSLSRGWAKSGPKAPL